MVEVIDRNGARLLHLIEDLLALSNVDGERVRVCPAPSALGPIVERAGVAASAEAEQRGITLLVDVDADLGIARADRSQLDRAVSNLLSNALKFTPEGGRVTLRARADGEELVITVSDTGVGIPLEEQPFVFERFYRASSVRARAIPGAGLGLSIVRAIAEAHNGTIGLESEEGTGTTATLGIPLGQPDTSAAPVESVTGRSPCQSAAAAHTEGDASYVSPADPRRP